MSGILDSAMFFRTFELSKHRRYFARIKDAIPGQLKAVDKLLDQRIMGSSDDTAYAGPKLAEDAMFGEGFGASKLAKALRSHHRPQESKISRAQCSVQLRKKSWARDYAVRNVWRRSQSAVDPSGGDQVGNAM